MVLGALTWVYLQFCLPSHNCASQSVSAHFHLLIPFSFDFSQHILYCQRPCYCIYNINCSFQFIPKVLQTHPLVEPEMEGTENTDTDTQHADTDIISQGQATSGPCIWDCTLCSQHCTINDKVETWYESSILQILTFLRNETGQATLFLLITSNKSIYNQTQWFSMRDIRLVWHNLSFLAF